MKRWLGVGLLALLVLGAAGLFVIQLDWLGRPEVDGEISDGPRPREVIEAGIASQAATRRSLRADTSKQVLFGDFHVHTTFSFDAFLMNLPMTGGSGTRPPADACDFARYCSALDFWSINDHAENLTADLWQETVDSVRRCNEVAGDPVNPDLVTYLGWEWSHIGSTPESHYGHKNVVLRDTDEGAIPTRPIGSLDPEAGIQFGPSLGMRLGLAALNGRRGLDFVRLLASVSDAPRCPSDVPVRELPPDCLESATTPEALFGKLDDWGFASLVIPHGTAWGLYTPAGSDWRKQLPGHDPKRQTLVEIYSGHGNSEQLPEWRAVEVAADGSLHCPAPSHGYLPSCWRAGELIEARCLEVGESAEVCAARAQTARANYVAAQQAGWKTLPGFEAGDWVNAGQAPRVERLPHRQRGYRLQGVCPRRDDRRPRAAPGAARHGCRRILWLRFRRRRARGRIGALPVERRDPAGLRTPAGATATPSGRLSNARRSTRRVGDARCSGSTCSHPKARAPRCPWAPPPDAAPCPAFAYAPPAPSNRSPDVPPTPSRVWDRSASKRSAAASVITRAMCAGRSRGSRSCASAPRFEKTSPSTGSWRTPGAPFAAPPTVPGACSNLRTRSSLARSVTPCTTHGPSKPRRR
jgi:hypothetical protein